MDRERLYRTEAIVLRRSDFGEADRLLTLLTPEFGKLRALAKGVRKIRSRKAGHVERFMRTSLLLARGRELDVISQAEVIAAHPRLREDLTRSTLAHYVAELAETFAPEGEESRALYRLLADTLDRLDTEDELQQIVRYYELHLLEIAGFRPQVEFCVGCGEPLREERGPYGFDPPRGGVLCPRCAPRFPAARPLSRRALKAMRFALRSTYPAFRAAPFSLQTIQELGEIISRHFLAILERRPRSLAFLSELTRASRTGGEPEG
ncbi:MAG: DNA repair protein RecO [Thermoflexus sp.]|uniref:DNA repair protein RecO n=1 Tax=Thermoflexus sp. TaxID=1969742 RepID=UPI0025D331BF|nr:DNA repair protein RecO [Thermoflexus sp.]MCS6962972.1 DNA repair protein RecO [Thermoflexus sp.]MDW8185709.1 DNA repair protein RecO [Anaerolineae bacterium]